MYSSIDIYKYVYIFFSIMGLTLQTLCQYEIPEVGVFCHLMLAQGGGLDRREVLMQSVGFFELALYV